MTRLSTSRSAFLLLRQASGESENHGKVCISRQPIRRSLHRENHFGDIACEEAEDSACSLASALASFCEARLPARSGTCLFFLGQPCRDAGLDSRDLRPGYGSTRSSWWMRIPMPPPLRVRTRFEKVFGGFLHRRKGRSGCAAGGTPGGFRLSVGWSPAACADFRGGLDLWGVRRPCRKDVSSRRPSARWTIGSNSRRASRALSDRDGRSRIIRGFEQLPDPALPRDSHDRFGFFRRHGTAEGRRNPSRKSGTGL